MHQRDLFLHHKDIDYLGKPYRAPIIKELVYRIAGSDSALFDLEAVREALDEHIQAPIKPAARVTLISDEAMLGHHCVDSSVFCRRLVDLFGRPKVIVVIRRQDELLLSWLFHVIKKKHELPLLERLNLLEAEAHTHTSLLHHLDYAPICRSFSDGLGRENLLVVPYELLRSDCLRYARTLSAFMEIDPGETYELLKHPGMRNARQPVRKVAYFDLKQRFLPARASPSMDAVLAKLIALTGANSHRVREIEARARDLCVKRYSKSNRALSENFGLDLKGFGYPGL